MALLPAWLLLHELPSYLSTLGIAITVLGVYVLSMRGRALHHPLEPFRKEKGARYMLYTVALVNAVSILDKIAVTASNALFYSFTTTIGAVIVLYLMLRICNVQELHRLKSRFKDLAAIGSLQGSSYTTFLLALSAGPVAYVTAIRSVNILISAGLGIILLKERLTIYKLISFALILTGGTLLALGS